MTDLYEDEEIRDREVILPGTYENCTFRNCRFQNGEFKDVNLTDCTFIECDLTLANVNETVLNEVRFQNCKLTGIRFDLADRHLFSIEIEGCQASLTSFYGRSMKNMRFSSSNLSEADFTASNLAGASFQDCDLTGAVFQGSVLEKADFRTSRGITINPDANRVKGARFSLDQLPGLLTEFQLKIEV